MTLIRQTWLGVAALLVSCGSSPPPQPTLTPVSQPDTSKTVTAQKPARPAEFAVISQTTPIFATADAEAPFLQFRTLERQAEIEAQRREEMNEYLVKRQERYAKEIANEKKKARKIRSREKRAEYAEARRKSRAVRHLKALSKKATRLGEGHPAARYAAVRVLEEKGSRVRVQTLVGEEENAHCYRKSFAFVGPARLSFWVEKSDLSLVTQRREKYEIWRGSGVETAAGVVVEADGNDRLVVVDGYRVRAPIPDEALGRTYKPGGMFEAPFTDTTFSDVALAEGLLAFDKNSALPFNPWLDMYITGTLWVGKRFYATTQTPCAAFTVHAREEFLEPVGRRATLRLSGSEPPATPPSARHNAKLYHPDGTLVGVALGAVHLGRSLGERGDRLCFDKLVWESKTASTRSFEWCVSRDDVNP